MSTTVIVGVFSALSGVLLGVGAMFYARANHQLESQQLELKVTQTINELLTIVHSGNLGLSQQKVSIISLVEIAKKSDFKLKRKIFVGLHINWAYWKTEQGNNDIVAFIDYEIGKDPTWIRIQQAGYHIGPN
jgi:hypothetical protein